MEFRSIWAQAFWQEAHMEDRLVRLQTGIQQTNASLSWWNNIRGLTLRLDRLASLGATPEFLQKWEHGQPLVPSRLRPKECRIIHHWMSTTRGLLPSGID